MSNNWFVAVILAVCGSLLSAYGWMLQKKVHNKMATNQMKSDTDSSEINVQDAKLDYLKEWRWYAGYITYGLGATVSAIPFGMAPMALILPLSPLIIVWNIVFGAKCLDEHLYKKDYIGIILMVFGAILVVLVAPKGENDEGFTTEDLEKLFRQPEFLTFISIYSFLVLIHYLVVRYLTVKSDAFFMIGYTNISAYFGSWNLLMTACLMRIFASSFQSEQIAIENWTHWLTYILIILWLITVLSLEYWRQRALSSYISTYVSAMYTSISVLGGILFAGIFFRDFDETDNVAIVVFCMGVSIVLIGVVVIALDVDENDQLKDRKTMNVPKQIQATSNENDIKDDSSDGTGEQDAVQLTEQTELIDQQSSEST